MIKAYEEEIIAKSERIDPDRKATLHGLAKQIISIKLDHGMANLNCICTHNSRRSQAAQFALNHWVNYFGLENIFAYSGGTEETSFNENMVNTITQAGFALERIDETINPKYVDYNQSMELHQTYFSKVFDSPFNPSEHMIAIMVCNDADTNCPAVPGAIYRHALPFVDPKHSDGQDNVKETYKNAFEEISSQMYYICKFIHESK